VIYIDKARQIIVGFRANGVQALGQQPQLITRAGVASLGCVNHRAEARAELVHECAALTCAGFELSTQLAFQCEFFGQAIDRCGALHLRLALDRERGRQMFNLLAKFLT
jgi:hypothetical protein